MSLAENPGFERPIFGPEEVLTRNDMRSSDLYGMAANGLFVRPIEVSDLFRNTIAEEGLDAALAIADEELNFLAATCNAQVVPHTWGLAKLPSIERKALPGYHLVAEVAYIEPVRPPSYDFWQREIARGITAYRQLTRKYKCTELFPDQFMPGTPEWPQNPLTGLQISI